MYSSGALRRARTLTGLDPGWRGVGGLRLATTPERVEELRRQASSATTYGLELELLTPAETRERLPLLDVDDVSAAGWLPGDGWLDPRSWPPRSPPARARSASASSPAPGSPGVETVAGRVRGVVTDRGAIADRGRRRRRRGPRPARRPAGRRRHPDRADQAPVRRHRAAPRAGVPVDAPDGPRPRPHRVLPRRGRRAACWSAATCGTRSPWDDAEPLAEPRTLFEPDLDRFAESWEQRAGAGCRRCARSAIDRVVHGPEAFTPDGEFLLGETAVAGLLGRRRVLRARARRRRRRRQGDGRVDRRRQPGVRRLPRWTSAASARTTARRGYTLAPRRSTPTPATTTWSTRTRSGRPAGRCAGPPASAALRDAGRRASARRPAGSGQLVRAPTPPARRRGAAPARLGRPALVAGHRRASRRRPRRRRPVRPVLVRQARRPRARARRRSCNGCAPTTSTGRSAPSSTPSCSTPRGGIEADLTVTRLGRDALPHRHQHRRSACATAAWIRRHLPRAAGVRSTTSPSAHGCLCLWGPRGPRHPRSR